MKLDKYLNEGVTRVDWKKLSSGSRQAINKLEANVDFRDMTKLLDAVINNVYQDGYDKGWDVGRDVGIDYMERD